MLGLCGGYQMLGRRISDPSGIEGEAADVDGLGHLDVETVLTGEKSLVSVTGTNFRQRAVCPATRCIWAKRTVRIVHAPLPQLSGDRPDGATSPSGRISGTYVHGLLADDAQAQRVADAIGRSPFPILAFEAGVEAALDGLAAHVEAHLDVDGIIAHAT